MGVAPCEIWKSLSSREFSLVVIERKSKFQSADKRNADALPAELNSQMSLDLSRLNLAKRLPYLTGGNPQLLPAF